MLITYVITPFIFAFLIGINNFLKNPIYIRRFAKFLYIIQFIFSCVLFFFANTTSFEFQNINLILDKNTQFLLLLTNFIFFLYSIISKAFILKLHKLFYATSFLLLAIIDFAILLDNIFIFLISLFWIILINYFLSISFSKKEYTKQIKYQLTNDLIWFFAAISLILYDFARYFILNDIDFTFSNLNSNLDKIDSFSINYAFIGTLILVAKLFNLIPFNAKTLSLSNKINFYIYSLNFISNFILGYFLFLKLYTIFNHLFLEFQNEISIFLLVNFIIYVILTFNQKNLFKFITSAFCAITILAFFIIFSIEENYNAIFLYSISTLFLSYCLSAFTFMILADKFQTDNLDDFKKIEDKTRLSQIFTTFALLNIASTPLLPIFNSELIYFMAIFSNESEEALLNIAPYCFIFGIFIISLACFSILYKIMIEPTQKSNTQVSFCIHQISVCTILTIILGVIGMFPKHFLEQILLFIN